MNYEVWIQGYAATGDAGKAQLVGSTNAASFQEACDKVCNTPGFKDKWGAYDSKKLTVWGCKLFDNATDARKAFG